MDETTTSSSAYIYIIGPLVTAAIAGIGFLVKYALGKRDERHREEIEERDRRRDEIEKSINELKKDNLKLQAALLGCDNPDCPAKKVMADYYKNKQSTAD